MRTNTITTQRDVRRMFWAETKDNPRVMPCRSRVTGDYYTDTRVAFVEFVDALERNGVISAALAQRVTL